MKASKYNFLYPYKYDNKKYIACNVLTSSLALIDEEYYKQYIAFSDEGVDIEDSEFIVNLRKGGFIIDKTIDELKLIRYDMYKAKFNTNELSLTIAPTSDCNFRCVYCYEKDVINKEKMTKETADCIIDFIKKQANVLKYLNIGWYGGEPLLEVDMIKYLSSEITKVCNENNILYHGSMVTNGYFLDEKNIQVLQKSKVSKIQITIDGAEVVHNKRRPLLDGGPTFNTIINNLKIIKKYNYIVYLRINVDEENKEDAFRVVDILEKMELTKWVIPYIAMVKNYDNCYHDDKCMGDYDYLNAKETFNSYIEKKGFINHFNKNSLPHRVNYFCSADKANDLVIDAGGRLYKCWTDIGKHNLSVGNIKDGISKNSIYLKYVMEDPTVDFECSGCKYLPICLSGCPADRHAKQEITCLESRTNLKNALYTIAENYCVEVK